MGYNFANNLTVNGTQNLLALLTALGYDGPATVQKEGTLYNTDGAVPCYLHFTDSSVNPPGVKQVESTPVVGTITVAGNATFTITAASLTGSPLAISVPVTVGMTATDVCNAAVRVLSTNVAINAFYGGLFDMIWATTLTTLNLRKKTAAANDGTMNIAYTNGTCSGLTPDATSDHTTAGALYTTEGLPILTSAPYSVFTLAKGTDLSTTWLYTASSITVKAVIEN